MLLLKAFCCGIGMVLIIGWLFWVPSILWQWMGFNDYWNGHCLAAYFSAGWLTLHISSAIAFVFLSIHQ